MEFCPPALLEDPKEIASIALAVELYPIATAPVALGTIAPSPSVPASAHVPIAKESLVLDFELSPIAIDRYPVAVANEVPLILPLTVTALFSCRPIKTYSSGFVVARPYLSTYSPAAFV